MQRDDPRERAWRGRDDDLELWGRDMDQEDWLRGTYGSGGMPLRSGRRVWGGDWDRGPDWNWNRGPGWQPGPSFHRGSSWSAARNQPQPPTWQHQGQGWQGGSAEQLGPEPWRGDRDWGQEWWHRNAGFGWTGNPFETRGRQWHGRTTARGYQRSDERIREDVYERLMEHPYIDTTDIVVSVSHGEVTLEGTVPDRWEKRLAEDLSEGVLGVTDVHNRLRAGPTPQPERGGTFGTSTQSTTTTATPSPSYPSASTFGQTPGAQPPRPTHEPPPPTPTGSTGEPASSSGSRLAQLREGMRVVGLDGEQIGQVKEVRGEDFLISRPMARDLSVPMRFVQNTHDDRIVLSIPAGQVDGMNWRSPELLGAPPPAGA